MYWNRWDIVEAHYWFAVHYHGGQCSDLYARQCHISRYFEPSILASGPSSENACMVYNDLERKHGFKGTPYECLPSGKARLVEIA